MKRIEFLINNCLVWCFVTVILNVPSLLLPELSFASEESVIAVLRFENKSTFDRLDPFEVALPYMLISDLSKISSIQLVERDKIDKLMAETGLAEKELMNPATMQRAGKALGADFIITGSFQEEIESGMAIEDMCESELNLSVQVRNVANGKIVKEIKVSGKTKEFFKIEKEAVKALIKVLNMSVSAGERKEVDSISSQSLEAVLHFGRGEEFRIMSGHYGIQDSRRGTFRGGISEVESEKLLLEAVSEFRQALYLDPQYADAQYAIAVTFGDLAGVASAGREKMDKYLPNEMAESEKFVSQFPKDARCVERLTCLGYICFDRGYASHADNKEQIEYFDKAIQWYRKRIFEYGYIQEGIIGAIERLGYTFQYKRDYINAIETYEYLIEHYPEEKSRHLYPVKIRTRHRIFDCYRRMKKHDKALEILNYIMTNELFAKPYLNKAYPKKKPDVRRDDNLVIKKLKGDIYFEIGDYQKAINEWLEMSDEVIELADNGARYIEGFSGFAVFHFWSDLAEAYRKLDKKAKVVYSLEKAISYPYRCNYNKLRAIYFELGQFYEQKGNYAKALSMYEASLERIGPDLHLEERIPICRQKLAIAGENLVEWVSFSPLRKRDKRFVTEPSIKGTDCTSTCITTWNHSAWIPFVVYSYYKRDSEGNFKFKITGNEYLCWYLYCLNLDSMTEKIIEVPGEFKIGYGEISGIAVDDKAIWLSCGKAGIVCYDRLLEKWIHFTTENGLVFNTTHCLTLSEETVWCGFGEEGRGAVMAYDRRQKKWFFYHHPVATTTAVTSLALDGDNLWVGNDEGTISILNTKDFSWKILHRDKKGYTSAVEDTFISKDTVWFVCHFNGIRRYNKETKEWKTWDWDEPDLDCSLALTCVNVDGSDVLVGGNGGVYKLDALSNRFAKIHGGRFFKLRGLSSIVICDKFVWFLMPGTLHDVIVHIRGSIVESALKVSQE